MLTFPTIAYRMLVKRFGLENIKEFWHDLGSTSIFENNNLFPNFSASDGYLVMKELYEFSRFNEYGKELLNFFKDAKPNFITVDKNDEIAHKYGWAQNVLHDLAIIYADEPYVLVIFSNRGKRSHTDFFKETSNRVNNIHEEYNQIKTEYCNQKKQEK